MVIMSEKMQSKQGPLELSPVLASHTSLCEEMNSRKLEELKSDTFIQSELAKRMHLRPCCPR